jgi:uncharacterized protein YjcR
MAKYVNEQAEKARVDYMAGMKYKKIAEKYNVSINTVKSWQKRHQWSKKSAHQTDEKECTQYKKRGAPYGSKNALGHGAPFGNKNALGNSGGAPYGNTYAVTHGLFAKYLPPETLEIADSISEISPLDMMWGNICIKYATIIRAQKIMYVNDKNDMTERTTMDGTEATMYQYQEAWDKQASFMVAQSKAMSTLTSMIKQYDELCRSELATEEQRMRIEKLKSDIELGKDRLEFDKKRAGEDEAENDAVQFIDNIGSDEDDTD